MVENYRTINGISEGLYKAKGSKFLSFAIPAGDVEEVRGHVAEYKKKYHDARHVCYAYMLGPERNDFRAADDGEPSGTAGRPILGQINSKELTNVLVVVVRYFGGVLLGTGGLVSAYKEAASDALEKAEIVEKTVDIEHRITFEYPLLDSVLKAIRESEANIIHQQFEMDCLLTFSVPACCEESLKKRFEKIEGISFIS